LWIRIRADLASYLVNRGADDARVAYWYHRQFVQAAYARYLSDSSERKRLHSAMLLIISWEELVGKSEIVQHLIFPLYHYIVRHEGVDNKGIRQLVVQFALINHQILKTKI